jgi:hypothetical protein
LIVGQNSAYWVLFHNLRDTILLKPRSEVWLEERLYIAADHTIGLRENDTFHLTMEERDPTDNRLVIMVRGKQRLANFVIQEEIPAAVKSPDVSAHLEAVRNIPEEQRCGIVPLPTLRAHNPKKTVSASFIYAKTVPPKADVKP